MIKFLLGLIVAVSITPSVSTAALSPSDRQAIPYENTAASINSGFENGISKWVSSPAITLASSTPQAGSKYAQWNSTSAAQTLTLGSIGRPEGQLEATCAVRVPSGTATHTFKVVESSGSTTVASMSIENSTTWRYQTLIFPSPAAGTLSIVFTSVAADEPSIDIDDCYVGRARNVGSTQLISEWQSYTPTLTNGTNVSVTKVSWRRVGDSVEILGYLSVGGAGSGTDLAVSLPSGIVMDTGKINGSANNHVLGSGEWLDNGVGRFILMPVYASTTVFSFQKQQIGGLQGSDLASGDAVSFTITAPIVGWTAQTTASIDAISKRGSIYFASGSATNTGSVAAFNVAGFGTNTLEGQALAPTTANDLGIRMTGAPAATYEVQATGRFYVSSAATTGTRTVCNYSLYDGTSTRGDSYAIATGAGSNETNDGVGTLTGQFVLSSAGTINVVVRGQRVTGNGTCYAEGPISISIKNVSQPSPAMVLPLSVSSALSNGAKIVTAKVQAINGSTCTISEEDGSGGAYDWLGSTTPIATGRCTVAINSGVFSATPKCFIEPIATTYTVATQSLASHFSALSTTSMTLELRYDTGGSNPISGDDSPMMVMCFGAR